MFYFFTKSPNLLPLVCARALFLKFLICFLNDLSKVKVMCLKVAFFYEIKSSRRKEGKQLFKTPALVFVCDVMVMCKRSLHSHECYRSSFQSHLVYSFCFSLKEQIHSDHFIYGWENWTLTDCSPRRNCLVLELQVIVKLPHASGEKACPWLEKQVGGGRGWGKLWL